MRGNPAETDGFYFRGLEKVPDPEGSPITSPIYAREAVAFLERHRAEPWFLYLPFNAVHGPSVATEPYLAKYAQLDKPRQSYAAMIHEFDDAIGTVLAKLRELKLEENTLVFLISDNGVASPLAEHSGLRGRKWFVWEGGVRVSWMAQWKGRIPGGRVLSEPVIQLDVLPTALAAAGAEVKPEWKLDGVNLLPLLEGKVDKLDREALYWRFGVQYAVRQGDWKLVKPGLEDKPMLVNLAKDRGEQTDLTAQQPEKASELQALWDRWNAGNQAPRWEDKRWNDGNTSKQANKNKKKKGGAP
jgi:arylsulfatase A-like enzyme